jgi:hypothetical protein
VNEGTRTVGVGLGRTEGLRGPGSEGRALGVFAEPEMETLKRPLQDREEKQPCLSLYI